MNTKDSYAPESEWKERNHDLAPDGLTLQELAFLAGTTHAVIEQMIDNDLIIPCEQENILVFKADDVRTVRKILRLRRHLQLSFDSMALIFDLLDRINLLEQRLGELENRAGR